MSAGIFYEERWARLTIESGIGVGWRGRGKSRGGDGGEGGIDAGRGRGAVLLHLHAVAAVGLVPQLDQVVQPGGVWFRVQSLGFRV